LIVNKVLLSGSEALKKPLSFHPTPLAVVATKEPPTSSLALAPKTMPLGLIEKKLG